MYAERSPLLLFRDGSFVAMDDGMCDDDDIGGRGKGGKLSTEAKSVVSVTSYRN